MSGATPAPIAVDVYGTVTGWLHCSLLRQAPVQAEPIQGRQATQPAAVASRLTRDVVQPTTPQRLQGHAVGGWHIGFDVTPCGTLVATGASDGNVHWYGYKSGDAIKGSAAKGGARHKAACSDVACHPVLPSVAASCGWDGQVCVLGRERRR